ncbi:N-acetylglucosamine-6-phosphate deacetylase [Quadrisphaera granulorum]|uniref:N-acetylglucosamine-6-phosphate deacetylase n=2 Tax=Quadrisphaera granulorum TaxID=317664 RepID=A0A316A842_9ACTN|nr:N-acetylglucosamine-6-phosphate deacetylase [Quadrisphaera granulorum]SZE96235.1 N-acetylglucosamine-6-phosphate deacetylase [Quadrisphaera granulorum]
MTTVLLRGQVHTGRRVITDGWVHLADGRVTAVGAGFQPPPPASREVRGHRVVPGFVDVHCHGGGGATFGASGGDPELEVDAARAVARLHRAHGTTTLVASLVSRPVPELVAVASALEPLVRSGELAGIHLEGPWLSPARAGAHAPTLLRRPIPEDVDALLATGVVVMVTLAPELPGGLDTVRQLARAGVLVAVGHTDADAATTRAAVDTGARVATHLFNAMPSVHHRAPGPVVALLGDERVVVELIADGVHLDPLVLTHAARAAGRGRWVLVTDAMAAAGCADGRYELGGAAVSVVGGVARLAPASGEGGDDGDRGDDGGALGAIAGSTLTLDAALRFAVDAGLPFGDVLTAVTSTPAGLLGRADRGHLEPGATGGAVLLDESLEVLSVHL